MAKAKDYYGWEYDDAIPAFVNAGGIFWFYRGTNNLLRKDSVARVMTRDGYTPGAKEMGSADDWLLEHTGIDPTLSAGGSGGGGGTGPSTAATAGTPGSFDADVPADKSALDALGALGNTTAWAPGEYVELGDASKAYWDGSAWQTGEAPAAAAPVTATVTGEGTSGLALEFGGGPQAGAGTVTVSGIAVDGTAIDVGAPIDIADGDDPAAVAGKVAAALTGKQDSGNTITLTAAATDETVNLTQAGAAGAGNFDSGATVVVA